LNYAGFWRRFGAFWIDFVVFTPVMAFAYFMSERFRLFSVYWFIPGAAIGLWFYVYLVAKYGGTPGKLLLKLKIALVDGSPVTYRAAAIRYAVLFLLSLASSAGIAAATWSMSDDLYFSLGYLERSKAITELAPSWYGIAAIGIQVWVWSEFISMLFNKKRRAIHDFMAGTVVIRFLK
jgi:uncharacterized RDD family membrane protein YckC